MPSKDELLQSIHPGMRLDKAFFLRVYGFEISFPGFAEEAIQKLEGIYILYAQADEVNPRIRYAEAVTAYEKSCESGMKEAAAWYVKNLKEKWERKVRTGSAGSRKSRYQFAGFPKDW